MALQLFYASSASWKGFIKELLPSIGSQAASALGNVIVMVLIAQAGDTRAIAVFGLCNFFVSLVVSPWTNTAAEVSGIYFAINIGAKRFDKVIDYFYKTMVIELGIFGSLFVLSCYATQILVLIGLDPAISKDAGRLIYASNLYLPFQHLNRLIGSFMGAQKTNGHFYLLSVISISLTLLLGTYFVQKKGMMEMGVVPTRLIVEGLLFLLNLFFMIRESKPECLGLPNFHTLFSGFMYYSQRILMSALSVFMEYLTYQYNMYLAALMHSIDALALWECYNSIGILFFYMSFGFSSVLRAHVGHLIGVGELQLARQECIAYYFYTFICSQAMGVVLLIFAWPIAGLYLTDPSLRLKLVNEIYLYFAFLYFLMIFYPTFSVFRLLSLDIYFFKMVMFVYPIIVLTINTSLVYVFDLGVAGLCLGNGLSCAVIVTIFLHKIFWLHDWVRDTPRPMSQQEKLESELMEKRRESFIRITIEGGGSIEDSALEEDLLLGRPSEQRSAQGSPKPSRAGRNSVGALVGSTAAPKTLKPSSFSKLNNGND